MASCSDTAVDGCKAAGTEAADGMKGGYPTADMMDTSATAACSKAAGDKAASGRAGGGTAANNKAAWSPLAGYSAGAGHGFTPMSL